MSFRPVTIGPAYGRPGVPPCREVHEVEILTLFSLILIDSKQMFQVAVPLPMSELPHFHHDVLMWVKRIPTWSLDPTLKGP